MMMYFEFNEDRLKQNNLTKEQCFTVIDKVMNEYGVHANQPGIYIASDESGFNAFSILKCNLPKTKWFLKVIEKWFWFDDEDDIDWNDEDNKMVAIFTCRCYITPIIRYVKRHDR